MNFAGPIPKGHPHFLSFLYSRLFVLLTIILALEFWKFATCSHSVGNQRKRISTLGSVLRPHFQNYRARESHGQRTWWISLLYVKRHLLKLPNKVRPKLLFKGSTIPPYRSTNHFVVLQENSKMVLYLRCICPVRLRPLMLTSFTMAPHIHASSVSVELLVLILLRLTLW